MNQDVKCIYNQQRGTEIHIADRRAHLPQQPLCTRKLFVPLNISKIYGQNIYIHIGSSIGVRVWHFRLLFALFWIQLTLHINLIRSTYLHILWYVFLHCLDVHYWNQLSRDIYRLERIRVRLLDCTGWILILLWNWELYCHLLRSRGRVQLVWFRCMIWNKLLSMIDFLLVRQQTYCTWVNNL